MSWLDSFKVIASGLEAQRVRMEVAAQNLAHADTTRTPAGGPYRRKEVVLAADLPAAQPLPAFLTMMRRLAASAPLPAVRVAEIRDDPSPPKQVYDPGHPDANPAGYVLLPNVEVPVEMADLIAASRAYEANATALQTLRRSLEQTLELLR
jgi:flagellar basal-body rod protein FlgC